jgi:class 3 adenylate cyclase
MISLPNVDCRICRTSAVLSTARPDYEVVQMTEVDLKDLLEGLDQKAKDEFASGPRVVDKGHDLDVAALPIEAREWHKVTDAVAVVADLKNSTRLGTGKHAKSTASIYEASTGGVVRIFDQFDADFLAIQGDGAFALFWGDKRYERALCAGITIKTFSVDLVQRLKDRWPDDDELPKTGFKVGVASSRLLVKRVGTPRNPNQQEPVWAGKAVNYAAKAAQGVDRHAMAVTGSVWDQAEKYDYLTYSCPCGDGPSPTIWEDHKIERLPDGDLESEGRVLSSAWCDTHGEEFCAAILRGAKKRGDLNQVKSQEVASQRRSALSLKAQRERLLLHARRAGLHG